MGLGPCRLVRSSSKLCPRLMGLVLTLGSKYKHAPDWKPKTSQHWIRAFNFWWLVRSQGCFDAKPISFIPLPHEAQTKVLLVLNWTKGKKNLFEAHSSLDLWKNFSCTHYEHPLLKPIDPIKYWWNFQRKLTSTFWYGSLFGFPIVWKNVTQVKSCSKILTKFDLGQYLFLRVQVSSREHYYVGSTWRLHGNCVLGGDSIFFKLLTLCITHFDQSSYGGDQMKKLPSQSEKVDIVKTLLFTYLISPFLIMCHWQDLILSHTHKRRRGDQLLPCDFFAPCKLSSTNLSVGP